MRKVGHPMGEAESVIPLPRARATGAEALAEILHAHRPLICSLARRVAGDDAEAEDVIQEALVAVATSTNRFRGSCKLSTWIAGITVRTAIRHVQRRRRREAMVAPLDTVGERAGRSRDPREAVEARDLRAHVLACIDRLAPEQRAIVCLRHLEGMALQEVAEALQVPLGTVKSRLHHARQALRTMMAPYLAESGGGTS
ncbi:MAG: sigma-70 family RNA polymerase sigma factor [Armatimonadetes bacterium]|nr:sigma-70 family RNA polymerase sigma factor [Armatimonadota bacterium]